MKSTVDMRTLQFRLFSSLEPEKVCQTLSELIAALIEPQAMAVAYFDPDFECFSEEHRYAFGARSKHLLEFIQSLDSDEIDWSRHICTLDAGDDLTPLFALPQSAPAAQTPLAVLFVAAEKNMTAEQLTDKLAPFQIQVPLAHAYEVAELRREVERLRSQYDQLEQELAEERRLSALSGISDKSYEAKFALDRKDKEILVYEISNAVRSSLDIKEVLQTAVTKIGGKFNLSRCLVIWPTPDCEEYAVYEYAAEAVPPAKELLFSESGKAFVKAASAKTAPHELFSGQQHASFDSDFLSRFQYKSAMLVPLIYQDRNVGSLFLQDCATMREWSIDSIDNETKDSTALICTLADLVTVAIEHANMHEEKKRQAVTDGLTGIANRRHFNETLVKEFERARRYGNKLSLVLVDLDYLKKINDTFGHHAGDESIKTIGQILNKSCRAVDLAARYGGEEFCLLLPDTDCGAAVNLAERVRALIEQTAVPEVGNITASIGVATFPEHADEPEELFQAADKALYAAKDGGRNRVVVAQ